MGADIRRRVSTRGEAADGGRFNPLAPRRKRDRGRMRIKKFKRTGSMWSSLIANTTRPGKVVLQFWGKRPPQTTERFNRETGQVETTTQAATVNQPALAAILQHGRPSRKNPFTGKVSARVAPEPKLILEANNREMRAMTDALGSVSPSKWLAGQAKVLTSHKAERAAFRATKPARDIAKAERKKANDLAKALKAIGVTIQGPV